MEIVRHYVRCPLSFNHANQPIYEYFIKTYNFYFLLFFHLTTKLPRDLTDTHLQSVYQCTHYALEKEETELPIQ